MLLDNHEAGGETGGVGGTGDGEDIQPVEEEHKVCAGGRYSLKSVMPLQSNLRGPPTQLPDSSVDCSGSGVCGKRCDWLYW